MSAHAAIDGLLKASTGLAALVSGRVYPDVMPDNPTYPAVTYQKLDGGSARGALVDPPLSHAEFQVSSWSKSRLATCELVDLVRAALDRVRKVTVSGVAIDDCFYLSDTDSYDNDTRTYFNHMSFKIHYRAA